MAYDIQYQQSALRALERLPKEVQGRVVRKIEALRDDPRPAGAIKLTGEDNYRIRVGDYRVIYSIFDDVLVVLILDIGHRGDVYRRR